MIWSSSLLLYGHPHQALLAATLLLLVSRGRKAPAEPGSSRGERHKAGKVVELMLDLPLFPWLRAATRAATQTSLQPAHPSRSVLILAVSLSSQAL